MDQAKEAMAARLRLAREHHGYDNPKDAADALGVPRPTYYGHENGSRGFRARAAFYAGRYRVRLIWLLTGAEPMTGPRLEQEFMGLEPELQAKTLEYIEFLKSNK